MLIGLGARDYGCLSAAKTGFMRPGMLPEGAAGLASDQHLLSVGHFPTVTPRTVRD